MHHCQETWINLNHDVINSLVSGQVAVILEMLSKLAKFGINSLAFHLNFAWQVFGVSLMINYHYTCITPLRMYHPRYMEVQVVTSGHILMWQMEKSGWTSLILVMRNKVVGGGGILVSLCPSVCPFCLDPFHIYASYKATSEGVSRAKFLAKFQNLQFWQIFKICNFDFVLFWLGIWCESLVWVIMGRRGVSQNAGVLVDSCYDLVPLME